MILGVDPGERRVGIAIADLETRFARPVEVIDRTESDAAQRIAALVDEHSVTRVVVGLPVSLSGSEGPAVDAARILVTELRATLAVDVVEFDERLTTVIAEQGLRSGGAGAAARAAVRDSVAAQVMLQGYMDTTDG
jgi:putative holliday junction resolvase